MTSEECRKNAQECMEQVNSAESAELRANLLKVAMEWLQLAEEIGRLEEENRDDPVTLRAVK